MIATPPNDPTTPPSAIAAAMLCVAGLWGSSFLVMKGLTDVLPPFAIAAVRGLVAAAALSLFIVVRGGSLRPRRADLLPALVMGTLHGWVPNALTVYAISGLGAGLAAMMQSSSPLIAAVLAHVFLPAERLTRGRWIGVAMGFAGVSTLIGPEAVSGSGAALWPALAMIATATSYAVGSIWVRGVKNIGAERLALGQQGFGGIAALALSIAFDPPGALAQTREVWPSLLTLGVLMSALPFTLFMWLIQRAGAVRAVMVGYLTPLVAAGLAALLLGETLGPRQLLGAAVILAGVYLVNRR